ncbi:triose-phosphate isomerase [Bacteroidota bacterium]
MRRRIVAGNWKMNTTVNEGIQLVNEVNSLLKESDTDTEVVVAPPFTHLAAIAAVISGPGSRIALSAQNCAAYESGAYTGEVSAGMLASLGCKYVIIGHSERREYFLESNPVLLAKIKLVLSKGMSPIFCIGERLEERESNSHFDVVAGQIKEVLFNLNESDVKKIVLAYEPVWAIGTGKTATSEQAEEMHAFIREITAQKFPETAPEIPILYGGSCKPSNAAEIFAKENVDGGLIGGASLVAGDFVSIVKSF